MSSEQTQTKKVFIIGHKNTVLKLLNPDIVLPVEDDEGNDLAVMGFVTDGKTLQHTNIPTDFMELNDIIHSPLGKLKKEISEAHAIFIVNNPHQTRTKKPNFVFAVSNLHLSSMPPVYIFGPQSASHSSSLFRLKGKPSEKIYFSESEFFEFTQKFVQEIEGEKPTEKTAPPNDVRINIDSKTTATHTRQVSSIGPKVGFFASAAAGATLGILVATHVLPLTPLVIGAIIASVAAALLCLIIASCMNKAARNAQAKSTSLIELK